MPNHVENELRVYGKLPRIAEVFSRYKSTEEHLDADKVIPYPEEFRDMDAAHKRLVEQAQAGLIPWDEAYKSKDGYNSGGYDWCVTNWGTKWGMYRTSEPVFYKRSAYVFFESAWSPPLPVIYQMSRDFPDLLFVLRYWEGGVGFKGDYRCKGGEIIIDHEFEYRGGRGG